MLRIQVGLSKLKDPLSNKSRPYKYSDIPSEKGWVEVLKFLPIPFDLMYLRVKDKGRTVSGWWNGQNWEGLRLKKEEKVLKWKRNQNYD
jgi:hypothetical protein